MIGAGRVEVFVPIKTKSQNEKLRAHWRVLRRESKHERNATALTLSSACKVGTPAVVTLTRHSAGRLDDDNLRGALKAIRDEVALWLGVDDGDACVEWRYAQEHSARTSAGVRISVKQTEEA